ncbi:MULTISPECIES: A/G-specific adenine glycosylase [Acutalibacteraceae]|uniref:A/G-specific adenine glycosylase n=1 Tax=Acutalibacteraceae TaxID=3082771 RepID=UPI001FAAE597|nr:MULTISPECIES: A/G-specific adenine glycosylase [Acutalibacteraceae]
MKMESCPAKGKKKMELSKITEPLLGWYGENARSLPWRDNPTPYRVWVSEIMLQQTRVEAVRPYFERFVRELPDLRALAEVSEDRLLKLWEGLGYYSRARNLQKAARAVLEQYGGVLPSDPKELLKLPGIGEYTAGAISSIAYGRPEPAVDGNVLRVLARLTADGRDIRGAAVKRGAAEKLRGVYPAGRSGDFTQALMELGATVCLPNGAPLCAGCPLSALCEGLKTGQAASLPVVSPKPARREEKKTVFLILCGGKAALRKRPETGLLAGMWEFPCVPGTLSAGEARRTLDEWGFPEAEAEPLPGAKHVFTHVEWHMAGYLAHTKERADGFFWAGPEDLSARCAVPSAYKNFLRILKSRGELC